MDCFKKCSQIVRLKWHEFKAQNWCNESGGDYFRSLDSLFVLGAIRYHPAKKWQQWCWKMYCFSRDLSYVVICLNFSEHLIGKLGFQLTTWHGMMCLAGGVCYVKELVLRRCYESIETARDYLNSNPCSSDDKAYDANRRKKFFQRIQLLVLVIHLTWLFNQVTLRVPNTGVEKLFAIPQIMHRLGPDWLADWLQFWYILTLCPTWFCRYFASTSMICSLLAGFKMELEIFDRGFENLLDNVQLDVQENMPPSTEAAATAEQQTLRQAQQDELYWKYLKHHVTDHVKQHIRLQEHIQLLQPLVRGLFGLIYYNAIVIVSPIIFILAQDKISVASALLISAIVFILFECYCWCQFVESFQDINSTQTVKILDVLMKIPHCKQYHKQYVEMRTMLLIWAVNVGNTARFDCGGVFPISVERFADLVDMAYTLLTFLLKFSKTA